MFNRNFIAVSCLNFFIMIPYYMLFVISMPYAVERFGASASVAGLVAGAMILGGLLGRFVSGRLIGIVGSRKVLFFGIAEFILTMALYLPADSLPRASEVGRHVTLWQPREGGHVGFAQGALPPGDVFWLPRAVGGWLLEHA